MDRKVIGWVLMNEDQKFVRVDVASGGYLEFLDSPGFLLSEQRAIDLHRDYGHLRSGIMRLPVYVEIPVQLNPPKPVFTHIESSSYEKILSGGLIRITLRRYLILKEGSYYGEAEEQLDHGMELCVRFDDRYYHSISELISKLNNEE